MDNRRLFLAAFLSLILVLVWGRFVQRPPVRPQSPATETPATETPDAASEPVRVPGTVPGTAAGDGRSGEAGAGEAKHLRGGVGADGAGRGVNREEEGGLAPEAASPAGPDVVAEVEEAVTVDTDRFRAEFSNRGATLHSFRLKRELDHAGEPLELVRARGSVDAYPFAVLDQAGSEVFGDALFVVSRSEAKDGATELRFSFRHGGRGAHKRFILHTTGVVEVDLEVEGAEGWQVLVGPGIRDLGADEMGNRFRQPKAGYLGSEDLETLAPKKQSEDVFLPVDGLRWATLEDNYFLQAVMPQEGLSGITIHPLRQRAEFDAQSRRFVSLAEAEGGEKDAFAPVQELLLHSAGAQARFVSFLGAKRYQELTTLPYGLEQTVRWGFFGVLARPLYYGLRWIHGRLPNYGWAIVLMTIVIKLVFFPLTHKGQKSMARMQELSPKIQAIRSRYRPKLKDKHGRPNREAQQQMNEELLGLYRKEGANPAGGCVPMVIQIPVFFAFFRLLQSAVELRNAPWIGWVHDLSSPDPWFVLPVMMLATSMLLQRLTPAPPDPMQRRIIQFMPIMFSVLAVTFPAGLVLYWTTNNLLTMAQQWYYHRSRKQEAGSSASRREGGRAGGGKVVGARGGRAGSRHNQQEKR